MNTVDWRKDWDEFGARLFARLEDGERQYGNASFAAPASSLLGELEQEALDLAGWGFILWRRIRQTRSRLQ